MSLSRGYEDKTLHPLQTIKSNVLDIPKISLTTFIRMLNQYFYSNLSQESFLHQRLHATFELLNETSLADESPSEQQPQSKKTTVDSPLYTEMFSLFKPS